jgi:hypothetical protein
LPAAWHAGVAHWPAVQVALQQSLDAEHPWPVERHC